ncbi:adenylate/guanylate cyclase domain-containing protein [Pseudonocardia sp.]|uniref:adenylate/guanylate cyclase domain-containing protein n=1 Tax=Pseudonocardia sp. TaxID=60912 RepID=UPI002F40BA93
MTDGDRSAGGELRKKVSEAFDQGRLAAQVFDAGGRLEWVSPQLMELVGTHNAGDLGIGEPISHVLESPLWQSVFTADAGQRMYDELSEHLDPMPGSAPLWVFPFEVGLSGRSRMIGGLGITLRGVDGGVAGTAVIFAPMLPARVLALVSEGDEAMFSRMADLVEPVRRPSAVLFADIDSSAVLSRRLPTEAFFELIRRFTTAFDSTVARYGGIVGKHAGDGASAFFLTDADAGDSTAALAALQTAYQLPCAVHRAAAELANTGVGLDPEACRLNIGLHWGANLYIGQIVTGGRLEVTALGDEVNECARIEQVATGGQLLATKTLIERLCDADAATARIDRRAIIYTTIGELGAENRKAVRDAGTLAVTALQPPG